MTSDPARHAPMEDTFNRTLEGFEAKYPALFAAFRAQGWSERWQADPAVLAGEPFWSRPFPMHVLARTLLERFDGLRCIEVGWAGVEFGCARVGTASTLKVVAPYEVEEFILEEEAPWQRPPAFPIGTMNDWMMFLRDDWTTVTVGFNWHDALITDDPFEAINALRTKSPHLWRDPTRHIEITDLDRVPSRLIGDAYEG